MLNIQIKFDSGQVQQVEDLTGQFMIRVEIELYSTGDTTPASDKLGMVSSMFKIGEGMITKSMEKLSLVVQGETETCVQYDTFKAIIALGKLPRHIKIDLLSESVFTGEKDYETSHRTRCPEFFHKWTSMVYSGKIRYLTAKFTDYNGPKIQLMGWKCFLKTTMKR